MDNPKSLFVWWFGTFLIFPCIGNNHPNWLIFFRGVAQPPTRLFVWKEFERMRISYCYATGDTGGGRWHWLELVSTWGFDSNWWYRPKWWQCSTGNWMNMNEHEWTWWESIKFGASQFLDKVICCPTEELVCRGLEDGTVKLWCVAAQSPRFFFD